MAYQRILRGAPATISVVFEDQYGEPRNVSGVTIDVKRANGSDLLHETALESNSETHEVATELTPAQTADLDILSLVATDADGSVATSTIDIVGGYLFSIAELRKQESSLANKPVDHLLRVRDQVESEAERFCNRSFVPRLVAIELPYEDVVTASRYVVDRLSWRSFEVDGTTYDDPSEFRWPYGYTSNHVTLYAEQGMEHVPADFKRDAIARAKDIIAGSSAAFDARATAMSNEQGTFSLVTAGVRGARTNSPDWNAALDAMAWDIGSVMSVPIR